MKEPKRYSSERVRLHHGGRERTFVVVTPSVLPATPRLLLYFHGSLQNGNVARNFTGRTFDEMAARTGTVLIYPDGVERHFNDARLLLGERTRELGIDDVGFTRALVSWAVDHRGVDPSQVYACGYSNGGQMVIRLLHDAPGLLAGAATFAAALPEEGNLIEGLGAPEPAPYLAIHGTADTIVKYEGGVAGLDEEHQRGSLLSALDSAGYFASVNGLAAGDHEHTVRDGLIIDSWARAGQPPVELWSVEGMGHVVPAPRGVQSSIIGPGFDAIVAADVVAEFFGWD
ncbi:Alpha/beta hydrolase family protein [Corynebacterium atrinae]|uniref:alpha/beta hydrolase family esterase n=1 Tax=Corynebacterium atrinae TaxID=1336740 RepID=UPI0025B2AEB4|nr:polyhydroxybutyrate depolymerase [Corynebacterium atrinae]WJY64314.1 Alpha/beta hydrolase family protein [Corynebacterium atrinae]